LALSGEKALVGVSVLVPSGEGLASRFCASAAPVSPATTKIALTAVDRAPFGLVFIEAFSSVRTEQTKNISIPRNGPRKPFKTL
jgi:hypothetical protein